MADPKSSLIDACYNLRGSESQWLSEIVRRFSRTDSYKLGVVGHFFEQANLGESASSSMIGFGVDESLLATIRNGTASAPEEALAAVYNPSHSPLFRPASRFYGVDDGTLPETAPQFHAPEFVAHGVKDMLGLFSFQADGSGCMVAPLLDKICREASRSRGFHTQLAIHISSGLRLRRALARLHITPDAIADQSIVFGPDGEIVHVPELGKSRDSLDSLRSLALAIDEKRSNADGDLREVLAIWTGLLQGKYSLVDHFASDGRRYLALVENTKKFRGPEELTDAERDVARSIALGMEDKEIAYARGESAVHTIKTLRQRAATKLQVSSREELARLILPFERHIDDDDIV